MTEGLAWGQDNAIVRFASQGIQTNDYWLRFVPESAGLVELPVERRGDDSGPIQLGYLVTGDTAEVGYDFSSVFGPVWFEAGETLQWVSQVSPALGGACPGRRSGS